MADMGERMESSEDTVPLDVAELAAMELGLLAVRAPEAKGASPIIFCFTLWHTPLHAAAASPIVKNLACQLTVKLPIMLMIQVQLPCPVS